MSRIGKRILNVPSDVNVLINEGEIEVSGKLGKMSQSFPKFLDVKFVDNTISVICKNDKKFTREMSGTINSLINSMIIGVSKGWKKQLKIIGVGYKAIMQANKLTINAGYSHPITLDIPTNLKIELPKPTEIIVSGISKENVGQFAAEIRAIRSPNPYSGKGIMYIDERIILKEGKAAGK